MSAPRWRGMVAVCLVPLLLAGCLSMDEPPPTASPSQPAPSASLPVPSAAPSAGPRDEGELVIALPELPGRLLPPAADLADSIALDLVHRTLYRLDPGLVPVPDLAAGMPKVSKDGRTWTVGLDLAGARLREAVGRSPRPTWRARSTWPGRRCASWSVTCAARCSPTSRPPRHPRTAPP